MSSVSDTNRDNVTEFIPDSDSQEQWLSENWKPVKPIIARSTEPFIAGPDQWEEFFRLLDFELPVGRKLADLPLHPVLFSDR